MSTSLAIVPVGPVIEHSVMEHPALMGVAMPAPVTNPQPRPFKFFDTPVLRYIGAKHQIADWITGQIPPHRCYVEPYAGSAAVFMRKHPSDIEILNDLSGDIVNFFRVLRSRPGELIYQITMTPWSHEEYVLSYEPCDDPLERARRLYVRLWQSFGSNGHLATGWRRIKNIAKSKHLPREFSRCEGLWGAAMALKDAVVDNRPALDVIPYYDSPDTLFYVDPPYVKSTRSDGGRTRYKHEMKNADHVALAETLHRCQGMVLLSGYDGPLYRELYPGWRVISKTTTTNGNSTATEYLWISPRCDAAQLPMFKGMME